MERQEDVYKKVAAELAHLGIKQSNDGSLRLGLSNVDVSMPR
jgi:hypothetical protein